MFEKHLWKSDILSKDAGHRPASLLKMSLFHRYFSNILLVKKEVPGLSISLSINNDFHWSKKKKNKFWEGEIQAFNNISLR